MNITTIIVRCRRRAIHTLNCHKHRYRASFAPSVDSSGEGKDCLGEGVELGLQPFDELKIREASEGLKALLAGADLKNPRNARMALAKQQLDLVLKTDEEKLTGLRPETNL